MSVLIKGKTMPKCCYTCPISNYDEFLDELFCDYIKGNVTQFQINRHPDCPLVDVPTPHGQLIDMDDIHSMPILSNRGTDYLNGEIFVLAKIDELDAVIEAESEE